MARKNLQMQRGPRPHHASDCHEHGNQHGHRGQTLPAIVHKFNGLNVYEVFSMDSPKRLVVAGRWRGSKSFSRATPITVR